MNLPEPILSQLQRDELCRRLGGVPSQLGKRLFVRVAENENEHGFRLYPFCGVGHMFRGYAPLNDDFRELPPEKVDDYYFEVDFVNFLASEPSNPIARPWFLKPEDESQSDV